MDRRTLKLSTIVCALIQVGCGQSPRNQGQPAGTEPSAAASRQKPDKIRDDPYLHNVFKVHGKVLSGCQPYGNEGFKALQEMGVKTVISVDGAKPDVQRAKKYGLRYVHLPHGYDGISDERVKELAKAVRELEGPIYIHCHHGKHRSPAAAAAACVTAGLIGPTDALALLTSAGTSLNYLGLYDTVRSSKRLDDKLLAELQVEFRETVELPPLAQAMVALEHTHDHLKQIAAADWKPTPQHPDIDPPHEALLLHEHFAEMLRMDAVQRQPAEFRKLLAESQAAGRALEKALRDWNNAGQPTPPPKTIAAAFDQVTAHCAACHRAYRDTPLGEKRMK